MMFKMPGVTLLAAGIFFAFFAATVSSACAEEDNIPKRILFSQKIFADTGDTVHVEG